MNTLLLNAGEDGSIARAVALLQAGELVALPTETVYGLAGDAGRPEVAAAIFHAKDRPLFDPLIVHLPTLEWVERVAQPTRGSGRLVERLVERFWPGPLTLLLPRRPETVPDLVTAGGALVAVRMSAHPVFRSVIEAFGRPGRIPLVLDAGPTTHGLESTIVSVGEDGALEILRHGPVTQETLAEFGLVRALPSPTTASASAPGQLPGHYAPRTPLEIVSPDEKISGAGASANWGRLAFRRDTAPANEEFAKTEYLTTTGDLREAASGFFAALRRLDESGVEKIVAETVPEVGLGRAIMERLRRAAAGSGTRQE